MIDTHCHLTFRDFEGCVDGVIERAAEAGVTGMISISTTTNDCLDALALAFRHPNVWCSAGVHPLHADEGPHIWENLAKVAMSPRCVAWGELGLDNHYDRPPRKIQDEVLAEQLAFIESQRKGGVDKPMVLHCRKAFDDLIPVLKGAGVDASRCVFHCFTGTPDDMRKVLDFGAMVSFTGVVTYKSAPEVREAAKLVPDDRIMVETDSPFLSPEPKRGLRPCEPWMVSFTAKRLAEVRGQPFEDFHRIINDNTERFFGVDAD